MSSPMGSPRSILCISCGTFITGNREHCQPSSSLGGFWAGYAAGFCDRLEQLLYNGTRMSALLLLEPGMSPSLGVWATAPGRKDR